MSPVRSAVRHGPLPSSYCSSSTARTVRSVPETVNGVPSNWTVERGVVDVRQPLHRDGGGPVEQVDQPVVVVHHAVQ